MSDDIRSPILLVDDEAGIRTVLGITLADSGYQVTTAENGEEALRLFREIRPAIVLTDIKMPDMDGIELLQHIKAEAPDTEVIMFTGHGDMELAIKSLKHDATDFVTKPINDDILEIALKRARERIAMRRQLHEYTHELERLVEEKARRLVEAERMAAVGQTVAELAHTIKNIANALKGSIYVLGKGIELDEREYLLEGWRMVESNVGKIKDLSLDLLHYGKYGQLCMQSCDPLQTGGGSPVPDARPRGRIRGGTGRRSGGGARAGRNGPRGAPALPGQPRRQRARLLPHSPGHPRPAADPAVSDGRGGVPGGRQRLRHGRGDPHASVSEFLQHQGDRGHRHRLDDGQTDRRPARGHYRGAQPPRHGNDRGGAAARRAAALGRGQPIVFLTMPTSFSGSNGFLTNATASLTAWSPSMPLMTTTGISRSSLSCRSLR